MPNTKVEIFLHSFSDEICGWNYFKLESLEPVRLSKEGNNQAVQVDSDDQFLNFNDVGLPNIPKPMI